MGLSPFHRSSFSTEDRSEREPGNPNPHRFEILSCEQYKNRFLTVIKYPDCTNFEGKKVIVTNVDPRTRSSLDPHLSRVLVDRLSKLITAELKSVLQPAIITTPRCSSTYTIRPLTCTEIWHVRSLVSYPTWSRSRHVIQQRMAMYFHSSMARTTKPTQRPFGALSILSS